MTEREYVEFIRKSAKDYRDLFAEGAMPAITDPAVLRWEAAKGMLAASTVIAMATAWLDLREIGE
jgi:hypothetical protein